MCPKREPITARQTQLFLPHRLHPFSVPHVNVKKVAKCNRPLPSQSFCSSGNQNEAIKFLIRKHTLYQVPQNCRDELVLLFFSFLIQLRYYQAKVQYCGILAKVKILESGIYLPPEPQANNADYVQSPSVAFSRF